MTTSTLDHLGATYSVRMELPEPPSANRYWRAVKGRVLLSREGRAYKLAVYALWLKGGQPHLPAHVPCSISVSWYRAAKRGDLDNRLKAAIDALKGLVFADDKDVVEIHACRLEDPTRARLDVWVEAIRTDFEILQLDDYGAKEP